MGVNYGYIQNQAGQVVAPTERAITSAMLETGSAGIKYDGKVLLSVNAAGRDSWPLVIWAYWLMHKEQFRSTCAIKRAAVDFLQWILTSDVARGTTANYGMVILPQAIDEALGISASLKKDILCDGSPVVASAAKADIRAVSSSMDSTPLRSLLGAFRDSSAVTTSYQVSINDAERALRRVMLQEVDLAIVVTSTLKTASVQALGSNNLIALPLWFQSLAVVHSLALPDGYELKLDLNTLARIWNGEITRWDHADIVRLNPELEGTGYLNYDITLIVRSHNFDVEKMFVRALQGASTTFGLTSDDLANGPSIVELPIYEDKLKPRSIEVPDNVISDYVSFTTGATAIMLYVDVATQQEGKPIYPTDESRRACETDTFNPVYNTYAHYRSQHPDCYPLSAVSNIIVQSTHTGDCTKIARSLQFARQIFSRTMSLARFHMTWVSAEEC